jgi:DHA2 family multidrug resistance protein
MPQMIMGFGMPFFFLTVTTMSLAAVLPRETASAAGLQSFLRTIAIAFTTSIAMTYWDNETRSAGSDLAGAIHPAETIGTLAAKGFSMEQTRAVIAQLVQQEALTLATDRIFFVSGTLTLLVAGFVWFAPRFKNPPIPSGGH